MAVKKRGLGKGLDALFEDNATEVSGSVTLKISEIEPNKNQPRKDFDQNALSDLADSIGTHGVLSPLLVRPMPHGNYLLVAGERRWRAARMAGLSEVPVIIKELNEIEAAEISLIENLQRENLNPVEEALGYQQLMDDYSFTQEDVAKRVNKSRSTVANALRLVNLPKEALKMLALGEISVGHAKVLLSLDDDEKIMSLAKESSRSGFSVRELEKRLKSGVDIKPKKSPKGELFKRDSIYKEIELAMSEGTARKIDIDEKKSRLSIEFFDREDLIMLVAKITDLI